MTCALRVLWLLPIVLPTASLADRPLTVAVASNFQTTAKEISVLFTESTDIPLRLSAGSTGKLYAQIINGAPYDVFLAADAARPQKLESAAIAASRMTYAIGSLVLWSADPALAGQDCRAALESGDYRRLAMANPSTAPYGKAAQEFLQNAGVSVDRKNGGTSRIVYGENISQTLNFVATGNATLGLIAASQTHAELPVVASCSWSVPQNLHSELLQQAVVIKASPNAADAQRFVHFLQTSQVRALLERRGYSVPE